MAKKADATTNIPLTEQASESVAPKLVLVKSGRLDGRVACWERHPDQPNGEICVDGEGVPVEVAETAKVLGCLADGSLVRA